MSPPLLWYFGGPQRAKVVPRENWWPEAERRNPVADAQAQRQSTVSLK